MRWTPAKVLGAVSDATIGTAIVMLRVVLAEREREQARKAERPKRPLIM